jgi:hypothetical protein
VTLQPFTVSARRADQRTVRIGMLAHSSAEALLTAQDLFPFHLVTAVELEPEWKDSPA